MSSFVQWRCFLSFNLFIPTAFGLGCIYIYTYIYICFRFKSALNSLVPGSRILCEILSLGKRELEAQSPLEYFSLDTSWNERKEIIVGHGGIFSALDCQQPVWPGLRHQRSGAAVVEPYQHRMHPSRRPLCL